MIEISNMAQNVTNSPIRKMFNIASTMKDVVSFTVGEPDFYTPRNIIDAAIKSLNEGKTHYTLNSGIFPLRQAISSNIKKDYGLDTDPQKNVIVTAGGMEALMLLMMVIINPGDEVIVSDPHWSNHPRQIQMCGGIPKFVKVYEKDGFVYDPESVKKAIGKRTKAILINSPSNPTGGVFDRDTLKELAKIAIDNNLLVISDDVYRRFLYEGTKFESITSFEGMQERTMIMDSCSKSYAMTGWRVGYAVGPDYIISNMVKLQENVIGCVNTQAQYAALEALEGTQEPLKAMINKYAERRELLISGINDIEGLSCDKPKGAFYAFVNISKTKMSSEDFSIKLLKETGVVVVPGSGFGEAGEGFIRMSYATSEENIAEGLKRIKKFVQSIK